MNQLGPDEAPGHRLMPMDCGLLQRVLLKGLVDRAERFPDGVSLPPSGFTSPISSAAPFGSGCAWVWRSSPRGYLVTVRAMESLRTWVGPAHAMYARSLKGPGCLGGGWSTVGLLQHRLYPSSRAMHMIKTNFIQKLLANPALSLRRVPRVVTEPSTRLAEIRSTWSSSKSALQYKTPALAHRRRHSITLAC
jgi:hypothetical protein